MFGTVIVILGVVAVLWFALCIWTISKEEKKPPKNRIDDDSLPPRDTGYLF